ncbi:TIGR00725 family protein [Candidatus Woesearchaeota archaeon]|nr:TIGR00725 family protein [Candidatus Woesearchaeota archaeon]
MKKILIAVVGHGDNAKKIHLKMAYKLGKEIAKKDHILLCGGRIEGIMGAAIKGCSDAGGISVGILPDSDLSKTSKHLKIPILTGMGFARNQIISLSCDGMIVVGGGVGTLTEVAYAYAYGKPIVFMKDSGGLVEQFSNKYMDEKERVKILEASTPEEAINLIKNSK